MSATEQATFEILVNGAQAKRELAALEESSRNLGGGLEHVKGGLEKFDAGARESSKVIRGLMGAMGDTHSQALEMLNIAGDLAGAFTSGGIFAVGMAAGTFAVSELAKAWNASANEAKAWSDVIKEKTTRSVDDLLKSIRDLNGELDTFGQSARDKQVSAAQAFVDDSTKYANQYRALSDEDAKQIASREHLLQLAEEGRTKMSGARAKQLEGEIESYRRLQQAADENLRIQERDAALGQTKLDTLKQLQTREDLFDQADKRKAAAESAGKLHEQYGQHDLDTMFHNLFAAQKLERERAQNLAESVDALMQAGAKVIDVAGEAIDPYEKWLRTENDIIDATPSWEETQVDAWLKVGQAVRDALPSVQDYGAYTQEALGIATSASQTFIDDLITGQDHATERFIANVSKQAGQALIGHGINLAGESVVSFLTPGLEPLGAAQAAGAAGLIGAGLALGGVGTGIEHTLAGGKIGQAIPDKDIGARHHGSGGGRSSSGSSSGGGGVTIVNNYSVAGPRAEDSARDMVDLLRTANRRRFT